MQTTTIVFFQNHYRWFIDITVNQIFILPLTFLQKRKLNLQQKFDFCIRNLIISLSNQFNQTYFYPFVSFCKRETRCVFYIKVYLWKSKILQKFKFEHLNSYHQTKKCDMCLLYASILQGVYDKKDSNFFWEFYSTLHFKWPRFLSLQKKRGGGLRVVLNFYDRPLIIEFLMNQKISDIIT